MSVPSTLVPFFQEYHFADLDPKKDEHNIIKRALQFGNRAKLRWLFSVYGQEHIVAWVRQFGEEKFPQPHHVFWQTIFVQAFPIPKP